MVLRFMETSLRRPHPNNWKHFLFDMRTTFPRSLITWSRKFTALDFRSKRKGLPKLCAGTKNVSLLGTFHRPFTRGMANCTSPRVFRWRSPWQDGTRRPTTTRRGMPGEDKGSRTGTCCNVNTCTNASECISSAGIVVCLSQPTSRGKALRSFVHFFFKPFALLVAIVS